MRRAARAACARRCAISRASGELIAAGGARGGVQVIPERAGSTTSSARATPRPGRPATSPSTSPARRCAIAASGTWRHGAAPLLFGFGIHGQIPVRRPRALAGHREGVVAGRAARSRADGAGAPDRRRDRARARLELSMVDHVTGRASRFEPVPPQEAVSGIRSGGSGLHRHRGSGARHPGRGPDRAPGSCATCESSRRSRSARLATSRRSTRGAFASPRSLSRRMCARPWPMTGSISCRSSCTRPGGCAGTSTGRWSS